MTTQSANQEEIYLVSADGGSPQQLLPEDPEPQQDPDWSPDGDKIRLRWRTG